MRCPSGKTAFSDYRAAETHLRNIRKRHAVGYRGHIYRCPLCQELHVGRDPKKLRQERRRRRI